MESIQCPDTLLAQLNTVWSTPGAESMSFDTLGQALECDDDNILATTLYRQVVLLGLPTAADLEAAGHGNNPVWKLLLTSLSADGAGGRKKPTKAAAALQAQYRADCALCSLSHGSHELMQRCRRRMAALPGCEQLLRSLLHWFPSTRASLASVPTSPMFDY